MDKSWIDKCFQDIEAYNIGVQQFLDWAFDDERISFRIGPEGDWIYCPCKRCKNTKMSGREDVHDHLILNGWWPRYINWDMHGEQVFRGEPSTTRLHQHEWSSENHENDDMIDMHHELGGFPENDDNDEETNVCTDDFYKLFADAEKPLAPGLKMSKLDFLLRLVKLKVKHRSSKKMMTDVLKLISDLFDKIEGYQMNWDDVQKELRSVGLGSKKIDACPNNCILFWKERSKLDSCPVCKTSRYISNNSSGEVNSNKKRKSAKVLRYFPLISRLQRLFLAPKSSKSMIWHEDTRIPDPNGLMHHPADADEWINFDRRYPEFAMEARNVRLGMSSHGFNPFGNMNNNYTIWPVMLVIYNLPPWMCMKSSFMMISCLIPGPKGPGIAIDVYMQPLLEELKELWINGVQTYDAFRKEMFCMWAALLWTINDFPAYPILSAWSTKGKLAYPICMDNTHNIRLEESSKQCYLGHRRFLPLGHRWRGHGFDERFDGRPAGEHLNLSRIPGSILWQQQQDLADIPLGSKYKQPGTGRWRKKSIFFQELPYWQEMQIRHNLDVMHIEKNVMENILEIFNLTGNSKDTLKARQDLQQLGIRKELHPVMLHGDRYELPNACYTISLENRMKIFEFLIDIQVPDGYSSNLSRCVNVAEKKIRVEKSRSSCVYAGFASISTPWLCTSRCS